MLRTIFAFAAVATTTVLAQGGGIPGLPDCAQPCVTNYGGCNQVDVQCICSNEPLIANLACCVGAQCSDADQQKVIEFADSLCGAYNVDTLPTAATCAPGAVSTPFTGTAVGSDATSGTAAPTGSSSAASADASPTGTADASGGAAISSAAESAVQTGAVADYKPQGVGLVMGLVGFLAAL